MAENAVKNRLFRHSAQLSCRITATALPEKPCFFAVFCKCSFRSRSFCAISGDVIRCKMRIFRAGMDGMAADKAGRDARPDLPLTPNRLSAVASNMSLNTGQLRLDFAGGAVGYRFRRGSGRAHPLLKAAGLRKERIPTVVDATAGLGRDAFLLASVGARIVLLERSADVHALLKDALARASAASPDLAEVIARMTLIHGDAKDHLPKLRPDVVIVDPMHPPRQNTALVKQEMRLLSGIVGADEDSYELMQIALASARERVVLKWPLRAAPLLEQPKPSHQFSGKTVRYEVFLTGIKTSVR